VALFVNSGALDTLVDDFDDEDLARFTRNLGMDGMSKSDVSAAGIMWWCVQEVLLPATHP